MIELIKNDGEDEEITSAVTTFKEQLQKIN